VNPRYDAVSTNLHARTGVGVAAQLAEVERESRGLHRQLLETRLGFTNALQYALLAHSQQEAARRAGPVTRRAKIEVGGDFGGERTLRLQELTQAKAELNPLRRRVATIRGNREYGNNGCAADPEAGPGDRFSAGTDRRAHNYPRHCYGKD
jgi:hypothetical protein